MLGWFFNGLGDMLGWLRLVLDGFERVLGWVWAIFGRLVDGFGMICGAG